MDKMIDGELIAEYESVPFSIGSIIIGASSGIYAKIIDIIGNSLFIMVIPFRLERQFNNVLFKMFER